jgi:N-acetylmuramoyl-L-alanine amidase
MTDEIDKAIEILLKIKEQLSSKDSDVSEAPAPDEIKKATIGFIVGHTRLSPGASLATGSSEYEYNSRVAQIAQDYAVKSFPNINYHTIFRDHIGITGAYARARDLDCDIIIELHFNSWNQEVTGTETLCSNEKIDQDFSEVVQEAMCKVFNRAGKSRGTKTISRSARGGQNVYSAPNIPNCLVEPFFGHVMSEAKMGLEKQEEYAKCLVDSCVTYLSLTNVL